MKVVKLEAGDSVVLKTTLGSCVGIILTDRANQVYGLAHVMLPAKVASDDAVGKYADSAVPALLSGMGGAANGAKGKIEALVVGGACMFQGVAGAITDIGNRNIEAVRKAIGAHRIPIVYEDTAGYQGRTVLFDCGRAEIIVRTLQKMEAAPKDTRVGKD